MTPVLNQISGMTLSIACLAGVAYAQSEPPVKRERTVTQEVKRDGVTVSRTTQRTSELLGRPIVSDSQNIGKIEDLVVDVNTGRVIYGVGSMSAPGATGRLYPIPWPAGQYSVATRTYNLPVETSRLESAPSFAPTEPPNFVDEEFATRTFKTYDVTPWWQTQRTVVRTSHPERTVWTSRPTTAYRITELRGREIQSPEGVSLGKIDEVVFDPATGRILYAVTTRDGQFVPIPWTALRFSGDKGFVLSISADRWRSAPVIETQQWTNLAEPAYTTRIYRYYEIDPDDIDWDDIDDDDDDDDDD